MDWISLYNPVRWGRIFVFWSLLAPLNLLGQTFEAVPAQPRLETTQGNVLATSIVVTNTSSSEITFSAQTTLPKGWRPVMRDPGFKLAPGKKETRIISFSMPSETPSGSYQVHYRIANASDPQNEQDVLIEVIVLPVRGLVLIVSDAPRFVVAGRQFAIRFSLTNSGNMGGRILLSTMNSDDFLVRLDSTRVLLGPKESRIVTAIVRTSDNVRQKIVNTVELFARLAADSTVEARVSGVVDVIPQVSDVSDRFLEFPLQVFGRAVGEDDRLGGQIEVTGVGSLSEERDDRLEVMVRTPDIQSKSSLAVRDEYKVRYQADGGEIQLGDWSYSLSPLTELNRYAFGGGGSLNLAGFTAGGFFNESRFFNPRQQQLAGFLKYEVLKGYQVGVNYLKKKEDEESDVSTIRGMFQPFSFTTIDMEYGESGRAGIRDHAYAAQLGARQDWGTMDVRWVSAGPRYAGYYRDLDYLSATASFYPLQNVHVEAYYRKEERNKERDTTFFYAPREEYLQIGAGYSSLISLYYRTSTQTDLFPVSQYQRKEDIAQVRIGYGFGPVSLFSNVDFGTIKDRLTGKTYPSRRYAVFSGFSPNAWQNYNTSLEYSEEQNLFTGEEQNRVSVSLGNTWFVTGSTSLLATMFWSRTTTPSASPSKQDFALIDFTLQHLFPFQHRIAVRARQTFLQQATNLKPSELAFQFEYRVPLAVPVKRLTSSGQVRGIVRNEKGKGLANVLVNASASAAITDSDGEYFFPSLTPGVHYLTVDKASIGLDRVTLQTMPIALVIAGGEEIKLDITVVDGCRVSGTVTLFDFAEDDTSSIVETGPRSGVIVELTSGPDIFRRVTDSRGRFVFADLKPGQWNISIVGGAIPSYHTIEASETSMNLPSGKHEQVSFRIMPRKRVIKIIQTGEVKKEVLSPAPPASESEQCLISYDPRTRGYILQVSSWETRSKAIERARVAEEVTGRKSSIQRSDVPGLGIRYRVKVGPFRSQMEAEVFCRRLQALEQQ